MLSVIFGPIMSLVGNVFGGINDHFKDKRKIKAAKVEAQLEVLKATQQHNLDWEKIWAKQAAESWKDEWWTAVVSIPLILCFIPATVGYVDAGFAALSTTPEWYQGMIMLAFGASFGVRIIPKGINIVKDILAK